MLLRSVAVGDAAFLVLGRELEVLDHLVEALLAIGVLQSHLSQLRHLLSALFAVEPCGWDADSYTVYVKAFDGLADVVERRRVVLPSVLFYHVDGVRSPRFDLLVYHGLGLHLRSLSGHRDVGTDDGHEVTTLAAGAVSQSHFIVIRRVHMKHDVL